MIHFSVLSVEAKKDLVLIQHRNCNTLITHFHVFSVQYLRVAFTLQTEI